MFGGGCGPLMPLNPPQWSPDGKQLAYVRYTESGALDLYLLNTEAQAKPRLISKECKRFSFSGDGSQLYFITKGPKDRDVFCRLLPRKPASDSEVLQKKTQKSKENIPGRKILLLAGRGSEFTGLQISPNEDGFIYLTEKAGNGDKTSLIQYDSQKGSSKVLEVSDKKNDLLQLLPLASGKDPFLMQLQTREIADTSVPVDGLAVAAKKKIIEILIRELPDGKLKRLGALTVKEDVEEELLAADYKNKQVLLALGNGNHCSLVLITSGSPPVFFSLKGLKKKYASQGDETPIPLGGVFSVDGKEIFVSLMSPGEAQALNGSDSKEKSLLSLHCQLFPKTGKLKVLSKARKILAGLPAWSEKSKARVEFTSGGLVLFGSDDSLARKVWPLTDYELFAALRLLVVGGKKDSALAMLEKRMNRGLPNEDRSALQSMKCELLTAMDRNQDAVNALLESLLRFPVTENCHDFKALNKKLIGLLAKQPQNRILQLVSQACSFRLAGRHKDAASKFAEASAQAGDRAWAAGLIFHQAMCLLNCGQFVKAGPLFRQASEVDEFPHSDWSAGMCVLAYVLAGRQQLAREELQRCRDIYPKSILTSDFRSMAGTLRRSEGKTRKVAEVDGVADVGLKKVRIEGRRVSRAHISFVPKSLPDRDDPCRLGLTMSSLYRLIIVNRDKTQNSLLDGICLPLSRLALSRDGKRIAFLAGEKGSRSLYVLGLDGKSYLGDLKRLHLGFSDPATRMEDYKWPEGQTLPSALK
jgi:tetratricopeptide (TPR) repeat protein